MSTARLFGTLLGISLLIWVGWQVNHRLQLASRLWSFSQLALPRAVGDRAAPIPSLVVRSTSLAKLADLNQTQVQRSIGSFLGNQGIRSQYPITEYTLSWQMSMEEGQLSPMTASVFVPQSAPGQQFPIIIYGAGTTGLDNRCAPSREDRRDPSLGNYRNQMISQASQGYVVVMPNYEGLDGDDETIQHYFNKDDEARSLLGSIKALLGQTEVENLPLKTDSIFLGGYSQGGHAAFAAADYAGVYLPDTPISGVFGHGPTTNTFELLKSNPNLAPYFVYAYSDYYPAFNPVDILNPAWLDSLEEARVLCVNEAFQTNSTTFTSVYTSAFGEALRNGTMSRTFPHLYQILRENNAGTIYRQTPTFIAQGNTDPIVTLEAQKNFVSELCRRRIPVQLQEYRNLHHFQTRQTSFSDTNNWINSIVRGETAPNNCQ